MRFEASFYAMVLFTASVLSAVVALAATSRRNVPGGHAFSLMMWAVVFWTLMSGLGCASLGLSSKILFTKLSLVAAQAVGPLFLIFAIQYSGAFDLTPLLGMLLAVIPVVSVVLAATNEAHHLVWARHIPAVVAGGSVVLSDYGPWYWISIPYLALLDLLGAISLVRFMAQAGRVYRLQTIILLAALASPWAGEVVSDLPVPPFPGLDTPAVGCAIAGIIIILGLLRYRLLDIVPVARRLLVERMADGLLVLDEKDRLVDANPAAQKLFGIGALSLGQTVEGVSETLHGLLGQAAGQEDFQAETGLPGNPQRNYDLYIAAIRNRDRKLEGRMVILRDVTARRQAEKEREALIVELQEALADIKTLRGLLPICMSCRKIRDDSGYWTNLEQYVEEHTQAQFSHGLCEDCLKRLYPDYRP